MGLGVDTITLPVQEKLRYLQQQLQDETPRRQEAELQELEQKLEAGLTRHGLGPAAPNQGCSGPPGSPEEPPRPRCLPSGGWGMGPRVGEGPYVNEQELQKVSTGLEELRWAGPRGGASTTGWTGPRGGAWRSFTQGWKQGGPRWAEPRGGASSSRGGRGKGVGPGGEVKWAGTHRGGDKRGAVGGADEETLHRGGAWRIRGGPEPVEPRGIEMGESGGGAQGLVGEV